MSDKKPHLVSKSDAKETPRKNVVVVAVNEADKKSRMKSLAKRVFGR